MNWGKDETILPSSFYKICEIEINFFILSRTEENREK